MKSCIAKLKTITKHSQDPAALSWKEWAKPLADLGITSRSVPETLREYLTTCLFEKPLNLTFSLYSLPQLKKFMAKDEFAQLSAAADYFIIGDRDGTFVCASLNDGSVAMIDGWAITEGKFTKEKKYKSLKSFFTAQVKHEKECAEYQAQADAEDAAFEQATKDDPNAVDSDGNTMLMKSWRDVAAMKKQLERGADPNVANQSGYNHPLQRSVGNEDVAAVKLLLKYNADPNANEGGNTPLWQAVAKGNKTIVKLLINAGANPDLPGLHNTTPLMRAAGQDDANMVKLLIKLGADPHLEVEGQTPLLASLPHPNVLKVLLKHGADLEQGDPRPLRALMYDKELTSMKLLIKAGAELNRPEDALLCNARTTEMVELLIKSGADVNGENNSGRRPLVSGMSLGEKAHEDRKQHTLDFAAVLLKHGADPNVAGRERYKNTTPLMIATQAGFIRAMQLLLDNGADPNLEVGGETAMSVAETVKPKRLAKQVVNFLRPYVAD